MNLEEGYKLDGLHRTSILTRDDYIIIFDIIWVTFQVTHISIFYWFHCTAENICVQLIRICMPIWSR